MVETGKRRLIARVSLALLVLLAVVGGFLVGLTKDPDYATERQVLFLSPPTAPDGSVVNPFLSFADSQRIAADVIALTLTDARVADQLAPAGSGAEYSVRALYGGAPILTIRVVATSAGHADELADSLVIRGSESLTTLQEESGAPKRTWLSTRLITTTPAEPERTRQILFGGVTAVGILVAGVGLLAIALRMTGGTIARAHEPETR